jgi:hypothetical protein
MRKPILLICALGLIATPPIMASAQEGRPESDSAWVGLGHLYFPRECVPPFGKSQRRYFRSEKAALAAGYRSAEGLYCKAPEKEAPFEIEHDVAFSNWRETLAAIPEGGLAPEHVYAFPSRRPKYGQRLGSECEGPQPDSLTLVSPLPAGMRYGPYLVLPFDTPTGDAAGRYMEPPTTPDTLRVALAKTYCFSNGRMETALLERDGGYLLYKQSSATPNQYPLLYGTASNGDLSPLVWDERLEHVTTQAGLDEELGRMRAAAAERERKAQERRRVAQRERIAGYRAKNWSQRAIDAVLEEKIYIGMNQEMVRESWGAPEDINRTIYPFGVHEQWVYGLGNYVYFEDGVVTTIQN